MTDPSVRTAKIYRVQVRARNSFKGLPHVTSLSSYNPVCINIYTIIISHCTNRKPKQRQIK